MVDQQTPSVRSDDELDREDAASEDARARRDEAGDLPIESNRRAQSEDPDQLPPDGNIADIDDDRAARSGREPDPDLKVRHARRTDTGDASAEPLVRSDRGATDAAGAAAGASEPNLALFDEESSKDLRDRWLNIQMQFVDSPKDAVQKAESLVGEVMQQLTDGFARQRRELEGSWSASEDTSTEDLRLAIRRYRSFFNRLLAI